MSQQKVEEIIEKLIDQNKTNGIIEERPYGGGFLNRVFFLDGKLAPRMVTCTEFGYQLTPTKKDGTPGRPQKKVIDIVHTYCPFCGEKYDTGKTPEQALADGDVIPG